MQNHFNGVSPGSGAKVLSTLLVHNGGKTAVVCPERQDHSSTQATLCMDDFRSATWERQAESAKDDPSI
jgi:hypothetical protein